MNETVFSPDNYIEYRPGNCNLILTIPHGGNLRPDSIPDRDAGYMWNGRCVYRHDSQAAKDFNNCSVRYRRDDFTKELGMLLADAYQRLTNHRPHLIISHLYRGKLDVNCDIEKATFGVLEAQNAWHSWHDFIQQAKDGVGGRGLLIDIHGHAHPENWIELGYNISHQQLNQNDFKSVGTSIYGLALTNDLASDELFRRLIYGEKSFGGLISEEGYKVIPSPKHICPGDGNYYTGGFNTQHHGSHDGGRFDAIQLETPKCLRTHLEAPVYSAALARILDKFMKRYYS